MLAITYLSGGVIDDAPNKNIAELWDYDANTYTRFDEQGEVVETRPIEGDA